MLAISSFFGLAEARTRPAPAAIERMVPAKTAGAVFVNVKRLFALYGDLIRRSPGWDKVQEAVAKGLPDPERDLDAIGIVSDLESSRTSAVGVVMTGRIDLPRLMTACEVESHATWTHASYRGVALHTADVDGQNVQVGQVADGPTLLSFDPSHAHAPAKAIVATLAGGSSFGSAHRFTLPADWLINGSIQIPAELSAQATALGPQFAILSRIRFASASVAAADAEADGTVALKLTCDTHASAQALHALCAGLAGLLTASRRGGPTDLLNRVQLAVFGASLTLTLALPRAELEQALGGHAR